MPRRVVVIPYVYQLPHKSRYICKFSGMHGTINRFEHFETCTVHRAHGCNDTCLIFNYWCKKCTLAKDKKKMKSMFLIFFYPWRVNVFCSSMFPRQTSFRQTLGYIQLLLHCRELLKKVIKKNTRLQCWHQRC